MKKRMLAAIVASMVWLPFWAAAQEGADLKPQEKNGKWGYVNSAGKKVVAFKYDAAEAFSEGLAKVSLKGQWCCIDKTGKVVTSLYDEIGEFSESLAAVKRKEKVGFIDMNGVEVIPLQYDSEKHSRQGAYAIKNHISLKSFRFSEGQAKVFLDNKWGFIDKSGKEIISVKYDEIGAFSESGKAYAQAGDQWSIIDKSGTEKEIAYRPGMPANVECNGKTYSIVDFTAGTKDGKTFITVVGTGVDLVPVITNKGSSINIPVGCSFIAEGTEYTSKSISVGDLSATFLFDTSIQPETVVFYSSDDPSSRVEVKVDNSVEN
jgi:hypothetical protein